MEYLIRIRKPLVMWELMNAVITYSSVPNDRLKSVIMTVYKGRRDALEPRY